MDCMPCACTAGGRHWVLLDGVKPKAPSSSAALSACGALLPGGVSVGTRTSACRKRTSSSKRRSMASSRRACSGAELCAGEAAWAVDIGRASGRSEVFNTRCVKARTASCDVVVGRAFQRVVADAARSGRARRASPAASLRAASSRRGRRRWACGRPAGRGVAPPLPSAAARRARSARRARASSSRPCIADRGAWAMRASSASVSRSPRSRAPRRWWRGCPG
jgi:hypothetical protein